MLQEQQPARITPCPERSACQPGARLCLGRLPSITSMAAHDSDAQRATRPATWGIARLTHDAWNTPCLFARDLRKFLPAC